MVILVDDLRTECMWLGTRNDWETIASLFASGCGDFPLDVPDTTAPYDSALRSVRIREVDTVLAIIECRQDESVLLIRGPRRCLALLGENSRGIMTADSSSNWHIDGLILGNVLTENSLPCMWCREE